MHSNFHNTSKFFLSFQRATLAEKEANALKEQLATSQPKDLCEVVVTTMSDCGSPPTDIIQRHTDRQIDEVTSKDKKVRFCQFSLTVTYLMSYLLLKRSYEAGNKERNSRPRLRSLDKGRLRNSFTI